RDEMRLFLIQAGERIMPEVPPDLADYAVKVLSRRPGVKILAQTPVQLIEPGRIHLKDQTIDADTIVLSAGILPAPIVAQLPLPKDQSGHLIVEGTMRCKVRPEIWAIGDCASIPDPHGKPYPKLAQFAMRQAKTLANNLYAASDNKPPAPFEFRTLGLMAAIGHYKGLGTVLGFQIRGFFAWWVRRTYYLSVMPRWSQRIRIVADWTIALFFRPEISKVDLGREQVAKMRFDPARQASIKSA
ncbi:MAG: FAD-dependent oxidoreductase, partial [Tepidisphaeraceae bacterium]